MSNYHPLEVVSRGSETQLGVCNKIEKNTLAGERLTPVVTKVMVNRPTGVTCEVLTL